MPALDPGSIIQAGFDILTTVVDAVTKKITAQLGSVVGETTDTDGAEWWQHVGFTSRPPKPEAGKQAAQGVVVRMGDHDVVIASQDLRGLELYGQLDHGETAMYAPGEDGKGQARIICKGDGSIHLYTTEGNAEGATGMSIQLDAGGSAIRLVSPSGNGITIDDDGITLAAGGAGLRLLASGDIKLVGTGQTQVDGAGIIIGGAGVPGVNSAIMGPAGIAGAPNPKVILGL